MNNLHYTSVGAGKTVILIHGWAMHSGIWQTFAEQLAQHCKVICLDLPGHGYSEKITPFSLTSVSDTILAALAREEPCCWLGWSLGATVVLDIAKRYPERVESLVLLAGNPCFIQQVDAGQPTWPGMSASRLAHFATQLTENCSATLLRFLLLQVQGLADAKEVCQQLKALTSSVPSPDTETLLGGLAILSTADLRADVAELTQPLLLVLGAKDALVPLAVGPAMVQLQPNVRLCCLASSAHAPFLSQCEETVAAISTFIGSL
ncbi:MAG: pimeloyl-ACP methyl ester esterase BioH [Methylovulum sp.]|jgi:pimeloyl-[acyl-carrier protein] methyl ester esterase